ncbi:tripartite motif containing 13-like [Mercenaria mercenaria]|uniref:tripartite motif containing 13-like n=1 Tax=Mercenaria mercenaria TaxID=6596 RepID=UPI00234E7610|nr:tripartite motif containing 13-like [Mercenaria mercenaria]
MDVVQEELLHCSICMELFSDPRTLPCQHTFCRDCLTNYIEGKRKNTYSRLNAFDCPLCRKNVSLENYDSNGGSFPINLVVSSLLNINKPRRRYKATASLCDKACQTSKETRFLRNKFSQTKQMQSKEVAAQTTTYVKTTNKRTQTDTEKTKVSHIEPQAQKQNKTTQTDRNRLAKTRQYQARQDQACNVIAIKDARQDQACNVIAITDQFQYGSFSSLETSGTEYSSGGLIT